MTQLLREKNWQRYEKICSDITNGTYCCKHKSKSSIGCPFLEYAHCFHVLELIRVVGVFRKSRS